MVVLLFVCLAFLLALLPIIIMRKITESRANAKIEKFYDRCRLIQIGMTKADVIYLLGNRYSFTSYADEEDCVWELSLPEAKNRISCSVIFVNGYVVSFPIIHRFSL